MVFSLDCKTLATDETAAGIGHYLHNCCPNPCCIATDNLKQPESLLSVFPQVENALQVAEQLVRAMPEELDNAAADLSSALVHVRCSTVEGEEDTAEDKRHGALVALLASSPLASVGVLTRELYSPHVDVSQRLLILDVMAGTTSFWSKTLETFRTETRSKTV